MCYNNSIYSNISTPAKNGLRLISINKASKLLGIRVSISTKIGYVWKNRIYEDRQKY